MVQWVGHIFSSYHFDSMGAPKLYHTNLARARNLIIAYFCRVKNTLDFLAIIYT